MDNKKNALILVVDDNQNNLQLVAEILEEEGYEAAIFLNGPDALDFLEVEKPELILLDVMMPGMDGYELCKRLKEEEATKHIPVIFLTAKTMSEDLIKGFEAGAVDYLTKPFNSAELLVRIKTHIELKRAREEIIALQGIIPICARCKKVREEDGIWEQIEMYIKKHSDALFSHTLCSECAEELYGEEEWFKDTKE